VKDKEDVKVSKGLETMSCKKHKYTTCPILEPANCKDGKDCMVCNDVHPLGGKVQSTNSGPWSLDHLPCMPILDDIYVPKCVQPDGNINEVQTVSLTTLKPKQKKLKRMDTNFKHSTSFLKRVARMQSVDRREI